MLSQSVGNLALTAYHKETRNLSDDVGMFGNKAHSGYPAIDLLLLKASTVSFNLVSFDACIPFYELQDLATNRQGSMDVFKIGHFTGFKKSTLCLDEGRKVSSNKRILSDGREVSCVFIASSKDEPFSVDGDCGSIVFIIDDEGRHRPIGTIWYTKNETLQTGYFSAREASYREESEEEKLEDELLLLAETNRARLQNQLWIKIP